MRKPILFGTYPSPAIYGGLTSGFKCVGGGVLNPSPRYLSVNEVQKNICISFASGLVTAK